MDNDDYPILLSELGHEQIDSIRKIRVLYLLAIQQSNIPNITKMLPQRSTTILEKKTPKIFRFNNVLTPTQSSRLKGNFKLMKFIATSCYEKPNFKTILSTRSR